MSSNQNGFGAVEALLVIVIIGLIGGVGYYVVDANKSKPESANQLTESKSAANESQSAPEIKNASDLDKASTTLDQASNDDDLNEANSIEKDVNNL